MLPPGLIALPLQRSARLRGTTVFLDEELEPIEDQWSYLASVKPLDPSFVSSLVADAEREGRVFGGLQDASAERAKPWRPARSLEDRLRESSLPEAASATLADRIYLRRDDLPSPLVDAVRRIAAFSNPQFHERQAVRLPTNRTPKGSRSR